MGLSLRGGSSRMETRSPEDNHPTHSIQGFHGDGACLTHKRRCGALTADLNGIGVVAMVGGTFITCILLPVKQARAGRISKSKYSFFICRFQFFFRLNQKRHEGFLIAIVPM